MPLTQLLKGPLLPGGELLAGTGGYILVSASMKDFIDNQMNAATTSNINGVTNKVARLDVAQWEVYRYYRESPVTHSGTGGAEANRRVLIAYQWACEVCYDVQNPPAYSLSSAASIGLVFFKGDPSNFITLAQCHRLVTPSALLTELRTIDNAKGQDIVRELATGKGNSPMFDLPLEDTSFANYVQFLQVRGWY